MKLIRGIGNILLVTIVLAYVSILALGFILQAKEYLEYFWRWIT